MSDSEEVLRRHLADEVADRERLEAALREIVRLADNATEHFNDLGMSDVARSALGDEQNTDTSAP